jgi:hypothetical protein
LKKRKSMEEEPCGHYDQHRKEYRELAKDLAKILRDCNMGIEELDKPEQEWPSRNGGPHSGSHLLSHLAECRGDCRACVLRVVDVLLNDRKVTSS